MLNYKKLLIWQKGIDIAVKTIVFAKTLPPDEKFGLSIQMHKAGISIPSNIAEGSSRKSQKDYYRFIEIALGSAFELETQVLISQAVNYSINISQIHGNRVIHFFTKREGRGRRCGHDNEIIILKDGI